MSRTSQYELADRLLGGTLTLKLASWRADGSSLEDIAYKLRAEHDINVSTATVYRWCAAQGITRPETEPAA